MMTLDLRRRFYAEEVAATSNLKSASVIDALATVPREQFLRPGPWTIRGEADFQSAPRQTPDADPRHVYHNLAVAIDSSRQLFNGAPGLLALAIDALMLQRGHRVLHIGAGTGYYTAIAAQCVGSSGEVVGIEIDPALAAEARANLAAMPWVNVHESDGSQPFDGGFDAILINAGVTHPLDSWLDALAPGGRMVLPLTAALGPGVPISKGLLLLLTRGADAIDVRIVTFVAIYSAIGLRDEAVNQQLGQALRSNPFPPLKRLRRDAHGREASCWLHTATCCFSMSQA